MLQAQIDALKMQYEAEEDELQTAIHQDQVRQATVQEEREAMARSRRAGGNSKTGGRNVKGTRG